MKRKGPIFTLAAGVLLAAILMVLNVNANAGRPPADTGSGAAATSPPRTAAPPTTAPPATAPAATTTPPAAPAQVTYAGSIGGGTVSLAIAIKDGKAIAYVCDGKRAEAWLQGTADNGALALTGAKGATLTGSIGGGRATGTVTATGKTWSFNLKTVAKPSGLYRASAEVRGAKIVGGWIVLADGTQVGVLDVGDQPQAAPRLDTTTNTAEVNGDSVPVIPVDGTTLN